MVVPAASLDLRLELVSFANRSWLRKNAALPSLLRCPSVQCTVCAMLIDPVAEVVQQALDPFLPQARQPTFSDAIATVRRLLWAQTIFHTPSQEDVFHKLPRPFRRMLLDRLSAAA